MGTGILFVSPSYFFLFPWGTKPKNKIKGHLTGEYKIPVPFILEYYIG
jgi:hypothetical protein